MTFPASDLQIDCPSGGRYRPGMSVQAIQIGAYTGDIYHSEVPGSDILDQLGSIRQWFDNAPAIASLGRHALARHTVKVDGRDIALAVKSFSRESWWRDRHFLTTGSKAAKSFRIAVHLADHGVGTPRPFAFLDRWEKGRLLESYYLCWFQENITSFRDELNRLYTHDPLCRRIMTLMETVATEVARMHAAGVCHYDLGNQNILLRRLDDDTWGDVQFIDLNRARIFDRLRMKQRARDISRIDLPSDFLRVFKCMYFGHQHPGHRFQKWEADYRKRFHWHTVSRRYRHPIRTWKQQREAMGEAAPIQGRELWIWDDRSVQAVSTLLSKDRHLHYPAANNFYIARGVARSLAPVYRRYRDYMQVAFTREIDMTGRLGMAVGTEAGLTDQEWPLFEVLGQGPALLRLYRHAGREAQERTIAAARRIKASGRPVFVALVQDRASLREPKRWQKFIETWVPELSGVADWLEIGHAVNRVKWGVWDVREYRRLLEPVLQVARSSGTFQLSGPAVIDFEYHYLAAFLDMLPEPGCLDALSHHLYVDRRGAPENPQGRYAAVEKFALAKAFAAHSPGIKGDRLIVSEVNWPILDTGVYSPVCSPYVIPHSHTNDPSVDEETYANYMIRYELLALCSGFVDTVYWWRLVARGFGLVDDTTPTWRPRPAFYAMKQLAALLGTATYTGRLPSPTGTWLLQFRTRDGQRVVAAWAHPTPTSIRMTVACEGMVSRDGKDLPKPTDSLSLTTSPVYLLNVQ